MCSMENIQMCSMNNKWSELAGILGAVGRKYVLNKVKQTFKHVADHTIHKLDVIVHVYLFFGL